MGRQSDYFSGYTGCGPLPAQVVELLPNAEEIARELSETVFASTWGDAIEAAQTAEHYPEREESQRARAPEGFELPNLSGCDLCEMAPHNLMPPRFLAYARNAVAHAVALAFLRRDGPEILAAWGAADESHLGHALALEFMGTGAADREEIGERFAEALPCWDCDGRVYLDLAEIMEPDLRPTDSALALIAEANPAAILAQIREDLDTLPGRDALDSFAQGFNPELDIESLELIDGTRLYYANRGDTYAATLTWDGETLRVQSWGAALEHAEEVHTYATGETRCGYCSEWSARGEGDPCPSCGNTD